MDAIGRHPTDQIDQYHRHKEKTTILIPPVIRIRQGIKPTADNVHRSLAEKSSQVHILGFVPQQDTTALYQNALALTFMTFFGPDNLPPS